MQGQHVAAPSLAFPASVIDYVTHEYSQSRVILEYGAGGSTALAAHHAFKTFCVETDTAWILRLQKWLKAEGLLEKVVLHHADIGPTKQWGRPKRFRPDHILRYLRYPTSVWKRADFQEPDLVLIDGRFRVSSFLWVMQNISERTRVLFDDYNNRETYHFVERYQKPSRQIDRMAIFELEPRKLSTSERASAAKKLLESL